MNRSLAPRSSRRFKFLRAARPLFVAGLISFGYSSTHAANYYWDPTQTASTNGFGSGTWDKTLLNFYNGTADVVWADGNTANFGGTAGTYAVNLGVPISALNLQFTSSGYTITSSATNTLTFTGGFGVTGAGATIYAGGANGSTNTIAGPITIAATTNANTAATFSAAAGNTLNLTGAITQTTPNTSANTIYGPGTVNYSGTGFSVGKFNVQGGATYNLTGAMTGFTNTYAGVQGADATTASTWNVNAGGSVAGSAVTLFVGNGGTTVGNFSVNGTGTAIFGAVNAGNTFNGGVTAGDSTGTVTVNGGTLTSNGSVRLGSTGAGVGTLNLSNGGRLIMTNTATATIARATGTTGATGGSGTINFNGGGIQYNIAPTTVPAIAANITSVIQDSGATINTNSFNVTIASPFVHGGTAAIDGGLTKTSGGILTLTATNTYTGTATVSAGTLAISTNGGLGSGNVTLAANATLSLATGVTAAHNTTLANGVTSTLTLAATSSAVALNATVAGTVQDTVGILIVAGVTQTTPGTYGGAGSGATNILPEFTGLGVILVTTVPEPSTWATMIGGFACLLIFTARRQRRA